MVTVPVHVPAGRFATLTATVIVAGVVPLAGLALRNPGQLEALLAAVKLTGPPVLVTWNVWLAGPVAAPICELNARVGADTAMVCAAVTVRVTGTVIGLLAAPATAMVTVPLYVPCDSVAPFTEMVNWPGAV